MFWGVDLFSKKRVTLSEAKTLRLLNIQAMVTLKSQVLPIYRATVTTKSKNSQRPLYTFSSRASSSPGENLLNPGRVKPDNFFAAPFPVLISHVNPPSAATEPQDDVTAAREQCQTRSYSKRETYVQLHGQARLFRSGPISLGFATAGRGA